LDAVEVRAVIASVIITALLRLASRPVGTASRFILPADGLAPVLAQPRSSFVEPTIHVSLNSGRVGL
jgi:hypothetical protein